MGCDSEDVHGLHAGDDEYEDGRRVHEAERHEGPYWRCDERVCLAYKARARQIAKRAEQSSA